MDCAEGEFDGEVAARGGAGRGQEGEEGETHLELDVGLMTALARLRELRVNEGAPGYVDELRVAETAPAAEALANENLLVNLRSGWQPAHACLSRAFLRETRRRIRLS